jgi:hypothetical protein
MRRRAGRLAAVLLGLALVLAALAARGGHRPERLSLSAWQDRPPRDGDQIITDAPVVIRGMTEAAFTPRVPAELVPAPAGGRYLLAAFAVPGGHRLLLAPEAQVASLAHVPLAGVTVRPESVGVPGKAIAELRAALPKLDVRFVVGLGWSWRDAGSDGQALGVLALAIAVGAAIILLLSARGGGAARSAARDGSTRGTARRSDPPAAAPPAAESR